MSKQLLAKFMAGAITLGALAGCVDNDYDLDNLDKTVQLEVKDLTLPLNLESIQLKSIIDDSSDVIDVENGEYVIRKEGDFNSSDIEFDPIVLEAPVLNDSRMTINTSDAAQAIESLGTVSLDIKSKPVTFSYLTTDVSSDVIEIDDLGTNFTIDITIALEELAGKVSSLRFDDLLLQMPKGLTVVPGETDGEYNPATGDFHVGSRNVAGNELKIRLTANKVDSRSGFVFTPGVLRWNDDMRIKSGKAVIKKSDLSVAPSAIPSSVTLLTRFKLSSINLTSISGIIKHDITGFDLSTIDLSDLPKALSQGNTDIKLVNPQLKLSLNNPVGPYNMIVTTGLSLTPMRGDVASEPCRLPAGSITIPTTSTATEVVHLSLQPKLPASPAPGVTYVEFPKLANILSGAGIPSAIKVDFIDPILPSGRKVFDFPIGRPIGNVHGRYEFFTPLQLATGSTIIYTETEDGWFDEDLEKLTITELHVKALVTTDAPIELNFTGFPIDVNGNRINGVEIKGARVPANATDYPLDIYITGAVNSLDGIVFTATAKAVSEDVLKESLFLQLSKIRVTVSGHYIDKL